MRANPLRGAALAQQIVFIREERSASINLRQQRPSCGEQRIGISSGLAALKRACDQVDVEPRRRSFVHKRYSVVVRAHEPSHPTVAKTPGIEERPQICFAILRLKPFGCREVPPTIRPVRKRRATQVLSNIFQRGPRWSDALALHQYDRVIEIIDAIQWRKSADRKVTIGPEHRNLGFPICRQRNGLASQATVCLWGQSRRRDERDIEVAIPPTEPGMSHATDEVRAEQLGPECLLPARDKTAGKIYRRGSRKFIRLDMRNRR
jgi:hypothetical protein